MLMQFTPSTHALILERDASNATAQMKVERREGKGDEIAPMNRAGSECDASWIMADTYRSRMIWSSDCTYYGAHSNGLLVFARPIQETPSITVRNYRTSGVTNMMGLGLVTLEAAQEPQTGRGWDLRYAGPSWGSYAIAVDWVKRLRVFQGTTVFNYDNMMSAADSLTSERVYLAMTLVGDKLSFFFRDALVHEFTIDTSIPLYPTTSGYEENWLYTEISSQSSATGDPHLQNIHGERFDLMKPGTHVLINIPRGTRANNTMLRVQADARRLGDSCGDIYFQALNVTGSWAEAKQAGGYHYSVSQSDAKTSEWIAFGKVALKVVIGHTERNVQYLNVYVKHLGQSGVAVGGLLGEDDHDEASAPPEACLKRMFLKKGAQGILPRLSATSTAVASLT